jgi:hypothetical protein
MNRFRVKHTVFLLLLFFFALPASAISFIASEEELRQSVIALTRARHRAIHDLAQMKQHSAMGKREQQDYEKFVLYLTFRIGEYCQQLVAEHGSHSISGLQCPTGSKTQFDGPPAQVPTSQEHIVELEKLLNESLGQFDEELLKEEERMATRQPQTRETGYGHSGSGNGAAAGREGRAGGTSEQGSSSSDASDKDGMGGQGADNTESSSAQTGTEAGGASGTGEGVASGEGSGQGDGSEQAQGESSQAGTRELETRDDDIVARQLREAAEKETDPELKKKLWEEYYKYKEGSS